MSLRVLFVDFFSTIRAVMPKDINNLVIAVSLDSSLELLKHFSDIVVLDKEVVPNITKIYKTVYIRSHFSTPELTPQNFRNEIDNLVNQVKQLNPGVEFIDNMLDVNEIINFEDKWAQYQLYGEFMPRTKIYNKGTDVSDFNHPIFKKRLSSRGQGVTWDIARADSSTNEWLIQESLDIKEELRVYVVRGKIYLTATIRQNMTEGMTVQAINSRMLSKEELVFAANVAAERPDLDMIGLDIAITQEDKLYLMETNRSPGFAKFYTLTGINLAAELYAETSEKC